MASSRTEIRLGIASTTAGTGLISLGGRVPAGKRWDLNLLISNSSASTRTATAHIVQRYCSFSGGQEVASGSVGGNINTIDIHPNGKFAIGTLAGSNILLWRITAPTTITSYSTVAAGIGNLWDARFSPDGNWIAVAGTSSPYLKVFSFSEIYGVGLAVSDPATLPVGQCLSVAWHPSGSHVFTTSIVSPYMEGWPWSPGFGTKLSAPGTTPSAINTANPHCLEVRPQGDVIVKSISASPYVEAYAFSAGAFGSRFSNPGTLPDGVVYGMAWAPGGGAICVGTSSFAPRGYIWSAGWSTTIANMGSSAAAQFYTVVAPDDYSFYASAAPAAANSWTGAEWNPLGVLGRTFLASTGSSPGGRGVLVPGTGSGIIAVPVAQTLVLKTIIDTPVNSGGIGSILSGITVAANSTMKISGHVMNEGERLVVAASGAVDITASAVEITL